MVDFQELTDRQRECLLFIVTYIQDNLRPPTLREIGRALGIRSTNGVNDHVLALERKGYVERNETISRGVRPVGLRVVYDPPPGAEAPRSELFPPTLLTVEEAEYEEPLHGSLTSGGGHYVL